MPAIPMVLAASAWRVVEHAERVGVARERLLDAAGLELPASPTARMPFRALADLYEHAARLTGDDAFGLHVGIASHPRMFDALGHAALRSGTLAEAFDRIVRYYRLVQEGGRLEVERRGGVTRITYVVTDPGARTGRHEAEATIAILLRFLDVALGRPVAPRAVWLAHREPRRVSEHRRILRVVPRFGAPEHRLELDGALFDARLAHADAELVGVLDRLLERLLADLPDEPGLVPLVRERVARSLRGGAPDARRVARELGISARTMQRRLAAEGTSLRALVDAVRRELAVRYVGASDAALGEIASALGYADTPTFHRAFRRWTGHAPRAARRRR